MSKWYPYPQTRPNEAGYYLILYPGGLKENIADAEVAHFYESGDIIGQGKPEIEGSAEEKLLDSIFNRPIITANGGFYCSELKDGGGDKVCELKPTFWTFLPEPPDGYEYNK